MSYVYDIKHYNMTYAKTEGFTKELQDLALYAKVLSHPARIAILKFLADQKQCISGDISDFLPLSRTTVSQHLQELKKAGLIQGHIRGVKINYCLNPDGIEILRNYFLPFLNEIHIQNISCE